MHFPHSVADPLCAAPPQLGQVNLNGGFGRSFKIGQRARKKRADGLNVEGRQSQWAEDSGLANGIGRLSRGQVAFCCSNRDVNVSDRCQSTERLNAHCATCSHWDGLTENAQCSIVLFDARNLLLQGSIQCNALRPQDQFVKVLPVRRRDLHTGTDVLSDEVIVKNSNVAVWV